jgi:glycosyltransferase involved in cell wall biosynthesis
VGVLLDDVAVIVPAFEPDERLSSVLNEVQSRVGFVVVVDDGSSKEILVEGVQGRCFVVRNRKNKGVFDAIRAGLEHAKRIGARIGVVMAADGQMAVDDLEKMVFPIAVGHADFVKGNRLSHDCCPRAMPLLRRIGNYFLTFICRLVCFASEIMDSQCGYMAFRLDMLDRLPLFWIYPRYGYPLELIACVYGCGLRIAQVTTRPVYDGERSGISVLGAMVLFPFVAIRAMALRGFCTARRILQG